MCGALSTLLAVHRIRWELSYLSFGATAQGAQLFRSGGSGGVNGAARARHRKSRSSVW